MKIKFCTMLIACLAITIAWGCSGEKGSIADKANQAASQAKDAAGDVGDHAKDAMEKAESAAGDMKDQAGDMLGALKSQWNEQLEGFDKQLNGLKETAGKLDNGELNGYVQTIETKLSEVKDTISNLTGGNLDLAAIKDTVSSKLTELKGLFQAAEDKVKALMGGGH
ncbi:MAG: hypothetical protein KDA27_24060 [Candidatus Eisenbacteria bacterium]|uniref:Uncharacterized protein n=1 Tax=Eiseniibacteriota bacterium TaxID=2212470 RepID=A0A956NHM1_UNCEI|nr:hypothetical protein [Candidatus Eisenbacteria bacterium]MCB9464166.1 hypothetical protein [Candidatus Eisenbacteria bacterium]